MPAHPPRRSAARRSCRKSGLARTALQRELPFQVWDDRTLILPTIYVESVRAKAQGLLADLVALGDRPRRPAARKLLRDFVEWLNDVDGTMGYAIETEERDDIYASLKKSVGQSNKSPCWTR